MAIKIDISDNAGLVQAISDKDGGGVQITSDDLVKIKANTGIGFASSNSWSGTRFVVKNFSGEDQHGIKIDQNSEGMALWVDASSTNIANNTAVRINAAGSTHHGLHVYSSRATGATVPFINFETLDTNFDKTLLDINQAGSGPVIDFKDGGSTVLAISGSGATHLVAASAGAGTTLTIDSNKHIKVDSSDKRLKENIDNIDDPLEKVLSLKGRYFNMKDDVAKIRRMGLIAQEVLPNVPELTGVNPDGYMTVHYAHTVGLLIEAIKELEGKVSVLTARIDELESNN